MDGMITWLYVTWCNSIKNTADIPTVKNIQDYIMLYILYTSISSYIEILLFYLNFYIIFIKAYSFYIQQFCFI